MWVSKISSFGAHAVRKLAQGQMGLAPRASYSNAPGSIIQSLLRPPQKHQYFCTTASINSSTDGNEEKETINVTFVETDGTEVDAKVPIGTNMLEAALLYDIEIEGACEGSCACSTCHLIVTDVSYYNKLPDPTDEENDMLDLAFGLTTMSRLGCQIQATREIDRIRFALPSATRNFAVDKFISKPR